MTLVTGLSSVELPPMADCAENTHYNPLALFQMGPRPPRPCPKTKKKTQRQKDTKTQRHKDKIVLRTLTLFQMGSRQGHNMYFH